MRRPLLTVSAGALAVAAGGVSAVAPVPDPQEPNGLVLINPSA